MTSSDVAFLIMNYRLSLVRGRLHSFGSTITEPMETMLRSHREAIVEALQARVVSMVVADRPGHDLDPWRHAVPGLERMLVARTKLEQWTAEGRAPAVRWEPSVAIVDGETGAPLLPPSWMLPELLWLLKEEPRTAWPVLYLPAGSSGGTDGLLVYGRSS